MSVEPHAAAWMLGPGAVEISELLAQIPVDVQLGEADDSVIDEYYDFVGAQLRPPAGQYWLARPPGEGGE